MKNLFIFLVVLCSAKLSFAADDVQVFTFIKSLAPLGYKVLELDGRVDETTTTCHLEIFYLNGQIDCNAKATVTLYYPKNDENVPVYFTVIEESGSHPIVSASIEGNTLNAVSVDHPSGEVYLRKTETIMLSYTQTEIHAKIKNQTEGKAAEEVACSFQRL